MPMHPSKSGAITEDDLINLVQNKCSFFHLVWILEETWFIGVCSFKALYCASSLSPNLLVNNLCQSVAGSHVEIILIETLQIKTSHH